MLARLDNEPRPASLCLISALACQPFSRLTLHDRVSFAALALVFLVGSLEHFPVVYTVLSTSSTNAIDVRNSIFTTRVWCIPAGEPRTVDRGPCISQFVFPPAFLCIVTACLVSCLIRLFSMKTLFIYGIE